MNSPKFISVMPTIPVSNLDAAIDFYCDVLGFESSFRNGDAFAIVRRDGVELGLAPATIHGIPPGQGRAYLKLTGIESLYADYVSKGVETPHPLKTEEYGMKEFMISDLDQNLINFGERSEG